MEPEVRNTQPLKRTRTRAGSGRAGGAAARPPHSASRKRCCPRCDGGLKKCTRIALDDLRLKIKRPDLCWPGNLLEYHSRKQPLSRMLQRN